MPKPMTGRERVRRHRERLAAGWRVLLVTIHEDDIPLLVEHGWLAPRHVLDKSAITSAVEKIFDNWVVETQRNAAGGNHG